jgi:hypothetical protein
MTELSTVPPGLLGPALKLTGFLRMLTSGLVPVPDHVRSEAETLLGCIDEIVADRGRVDAATRALLAALDEEEGNRDGALVLPPDPRCSACTASGTVPTQPCARHAAALLVQYGPFDSSPGLRP